MQKKPIIGRTFADLIHFIITQRKTYITICAVLVISYGIYPDIGKQINTTVIAFRDKMLNIESTDIKLATIPTHPQKDIESIVNIETNYYTIQTFLARHEKHAQEAMTELWRPNYQVRMEVIQGKYYVFLGKYHTEREAFLALDDLLKSELKESLAVIESKPFVKYISKQKASISIASRNKLAR